MACGFCGCEEVVIGDGRAWCANEGCAAEQGVARFGLIQGRHDMPVDGYLLAPDITESVGYHDGVYQAAKQAAANRVRETGNFELYLTGLTIAAIGAAEGMRKAGIAQPVVCNYDAATKGYVRVELDA